MDKKVFVAVAVCAGLYLAWYSMNSKQHDSYQNAQVQQEASQSTPKQLERPKTAKVVVTTKQLSANSVSEEKEVILGASDFGMVISTSGGVVSNVLFPVYKGIKLENLDALISSRQQMELNFSSPEWSYLSTVRYKIQEQSKTSQGNDRLVLVYEDEKIKVQRKYTLKPNVYSLDADLDVVFKTTPPEFLYLGLKAIKDIDVGRNERRELFYNKRKKQDTLTVSSIDELKYVDGDFRWIGFSSRYFINALVDQGSRIRPEFIANPTADQLIAASLVYRMSERSVNIPVTMYYGPKDINILATVGQNLDMAVDFGYFTILAVPLLKTLKWFYQYVHNFGLAIILLTVLVKLAMYPLTFKSMKSMKEMQRIQPQIKKLREKYKDDKEKLNKEMLTLMRANGYNPMSGCFPIVIQMPIFIALYNVLWGAMELYGQPFAFWITDLSLKDPYFVMPVLLAGTMFIQQKLTPNTATDPAQQKMMMMMPLIFGFMMLWLPSGLTLYMLVNTVVSVVQQLVINKSLGNKSPQHPTVVTA